MLLERVVDLRLGKGRVGTERHALALRLLPLNLRHEQVVPVLGAMHVTGAQCCPEAVAILIEEKQRVVADGFEDPILDPGMLKRRSAPSALAAHLPWPNDAFFQLLRQFSVP